MPSSKSSKRWLEEHFADVYVKKAQKEGYRSRAIYKLQEIDLKAKLLEPGMTVIDLGAAPGSWTQYAAKKLHGNGILIAVDLLPMEELSGVHFICGDFREEAVVVELMNLIPKDKVDLILSDMAPNMSGFSAVDIPSAMYLSEITVDFASQVLKSGGNLLMKVFQGAGFEELIKQLRLQFNKVSSKKPLASRARSREIYLLATGYKLG